jgi:hypothetical protein
MLIILATATLGFAGTGTIQIGTYYGSTVTLPIDANCHYSYSQQIYLQSQIDREVEITELRFYLTFGSLTASKNWVIYMGHTTKTSFSSDTDWVPLNELTEVFAGDVSIYVPSPNNWMEIPLTTSFNYNNIDNLIIAVDENSPGYDMATWGAFTSGSNTGIYYSNSDEIINPDPLSPPSATGRSSFINAIQLGFPCSLPPLAPTLLFPLNMGWAFTNDNLEWKPTPGAGDAYNYDVYLGTNNNPPLVSENQTTTTFTPSLVSGTTYYWKVVSKNEFGNTESDIWSFKTPTSSQLAESFENTTFPPPNWTNPGSWSRGSGNAIHGSAQALKRGTSSGQFILSTPKVSIDAYSTLDFWSKCSGTTGRLQVIYSPNRTDWTQIGEDITCSSGNTWYHYVIDLSSLAGNNYYLGFRTAYTGQYYIDFILGPEITQEVPGLPTLVSPANGAQNVSINPTFTWSAPTSGGVPAGYKLYCGENSILNESNIIGDVSDLYYTISDNNPLQYNQTYYWTVSAYNNGGEGQKAEPYSFITRSVLNPPQNIVILAQDNTINISWETQPEATYYIIYGADDPYGDYTVLGYTETNSYLYSAIENNFKFFKIIATNGTIPIKEMFIKVSE